MFYLLNFIVKLKYSNKNKTFKKVKKCINKNFMKYFIYENLKQRLV